MMGKMNDADSDREMHMATSDSQNEESIISDTGSADSFDTAPPHKSRSIRGKKNGEPGKPDPGSKKGDATPAVITKDPDPEDELSGDSEREAEADSDPEARLRKELSSERDKYLRLAAEYDNFRKRSHKERENTYRDARADALLRLLPVYDNLERALRMECADEAFYKGVEMTMLGFNEILENLGVKRIESVGEPFDPNMHNAVMSIENPELGEKIVSEEFIKGFTLGDRVLRCSTVVVAN